MSLTSFPMSDLLMDILSERSFTPETQLSSKLPRWFRLWSAVTKFLAFTSAYSFGLYARSVSGNLLQLSKNLNDLSEVSKRYPLYMLPRNPETTPVFWSNGLSFEISIMGSIISSSFDLILKLLSVITTFLHLNGPYLSEYSSFLVDLMISETAEWSM